MKLYEMHELVELAALVANQIKENLDKRWYSGSEVELRIKWLATNEFIANASVEPTLQNIQRHVISLSYGVLGEIYSNAFEFARFAGAGPGGRMEHGIHTLPERFEMLHAAELMFISGISFVIFHELAHLNQNHGAIRAIYGQGLTSCISEFAVSGEVAFKGDQASISHATELAADFEALDWMAMMIQQFKGEEYLDHAYLQCAIVSCIMLMFNGGNPVRLDAQPIGTHPFPLLRMDCWVRLYAERISLLSRPLEISGNKTAIVKFLDDTSFLALLSCMTRLDCIDKPEYGDFCKGASTHPNYQSYMREVINIWSQHDEQARSSRRYGGPFSLLYFTDEFRAMVGAVGNRDTFSEHLQRANEAVAGSQKQK